MIDTLHTARWRARSVMIALAFAVAGCAGMEYGTAAGPADAEFVAMDVEGSKVWRGGQTIDLKARGATPLMIKVTNSLGADHGFSIDTMKVQEVIKPNEEKTITVPLENIDPTVTDHKVDCQLHPKHVAATLKVLGR